MLVPCVLELYLELRRFMSMGKCWNTKCRGTSIVIVPYIRHNAVHTAQCSIPYAIWNMPYGNRHPLYLITFCRKTYQCYWPNRVTLPLKFHKDFDIPSYPMVGDPQYGSSNDLMTDLHSQLKSLCSGPNFAELKWRNKMALLPSFQWRATHRSLVDGKGFTLLFLLLPQIPL